MCMKWKYSRSVCKQNRCFFFLSESQASLDVTDLMTELVK